MSTWEPGPGVVELPDGRRVRGSAVRRLHDGEPKPELVVYLLGRDPREDAWDSRWVRWPDFWLPASTTGALSALREAHERAADSRVAIACTGGVGRTGTSLAVLAMLSGVPAPDAVGWVRQRYHPGAVEVPWQRRWLRRVAPLL